MYSKSIISAMLLLGLSSSVSAQDYQLVWSDEFDSNTLGTNWNVETVSHPSNNELQYYTARSSNVDVHDGNLVLTARRESYGGRYFTSGRVNSTNKVNFMHGKIEARIKLPRLANGLWPAFWMMGDDIGSVGWPACGEIDIMEAGYMDGIKNGTQERLFSGCIHWGVSQADHQMWTSGAVTSTYDITGGDYHIFTAVWDADHIYCYLDNAAQPYYEATISEGYGSAKYFHKPFHILFNLAVGGDYTNIYNAGGITALPNAGSKVEMLVDYVRVYQKVGEQNVNYVDNDATGEQIHAAPQPTHPAADVISIFSDVYTPAGTGGFDTWGSPGETLSSGSVAGGDNVERVSNFQYVGFNFNSDYSVTDLSGMSYLHTDIFTTQPMTIGMTPVSKDPSGDYTKNREHALQFSLQAGWNSLDVPLSDYTAANPSIDLTQIHQMKWDGGDAKSTIYIDNVYFYRNATNGISRVETFKKSGDYYTLAGISCGKEPVGKGIFIRDGKKILR